MSSIDHESLKVTEIFASLQGETSTTGRPTTFVRLTGCPLRCHYCDTSYAFHGGKRQSLETILATVHELGCEYVTVTGGEPLAQPTCLQLLDAFIENDYHVSLETSGALSIKDVNPHVRIILDLKTPSSGECHRNLWENLPHLSKKKDEIKFVIGTQNDYDWAKNMIEQHQLLRCAEILFSPEHPTLKAQTLADWIVEDRLPVRFQIQLHKVLWGDTPGR